MPTRFADRILDALREQPCTADGLVERLDRPLSVVRNTLATMYFHDRVVGCDRRGRYYALDTIDRLNGVVVLMYDPRSPTGDRIAG